VGFSSTPIQRMSQLGQSEVQPASRLYPNSGHGLVPRKLTLCATCCCEPNHAQESWKGSLVISVLIGVLIIVVVGAICFWAIDKFATDSRLANLLKLLVVLVCLGAIFQRVLPLTY
jgi:hypothetical protein